MNVRKEISIRVLYKGNDVEYHFNLFPVKAFKSNKSRVNAAKVLGFAINENEGWYKMFQLAAMEIDRLQDKAMICWAEKNKNSKSKSDKELANYILNKPKF